MSPPRPPDPGAAAPSPAFVETPEEVAYELRAAEGSIYSGTRLLIGIVAFAFASLAFAYFYLRSADNEDLWRPHGVTAPTDIGAAIFAMTLTMGVLMVFGRRRFRQGAHLDWLVAGWTVVLGGFVVIGLQIWEYTRLPFFPGSSGYASCFVAWGAMNIALVLGVMYWTETLLARWVRLRRALVEEGAATGAHPAGRLFSAKVEGCELFTGFAAMVGLLFWLLFYVV